MNMKDIRWLVSQQVIIRAIVEITATAERRPQNGGGRITDHCAAFNYLNILGMNFKLTERNIHLSTVGSCRKH